MIWVSGPRPWKRCADELHELARLLVEADHVQAPEREGRVPDPGVAVVPVALPAGRLGQRGGQRGDHRPGRLVGQPLERQRRALQGPAPGVVRERPPLQPAAPQVDGALRPGRRRRRRRGAAQLLAPRKAARSSAPRPRASARRGRPRRRSPAGCRRAAAASRRRRWRRRRGRPGRRASSSSPRSRSRRPARRSSRPRPRRGRTRPCGRACARRRGGRASRACTSVAVLVAPRAPAPGRRGRRTTRWRVIQLVSRRSCLGRSGAPPAPAGPLGPRRQAPASRSSRAAKMLGESKRRRHIHSTVPSEATRAPGVAIGEEAVVADRVEVGTGGRGPEVLAFAGYAHLAGNAIAPPSRARSGIEALRTPPR